MENRRLFTGISELFTPFQKIPEAALAVGGDRFTWVGREQELPRRYRDWRGEDLGGRGVLPGLVDAHTHLVWAGSRLDEYVLRARGASYEEILEAGGGIYRTTRATQEASEDELFESARGRARTFLAGGITTVEVKSGYGLDPEHELKMLRVVRRLSESEPQRFVPTFLAHVVPKDRPRERHMEMLLREIIPEVARSGLAEAVDVFCDRGAFTLEEARRLLEAALERGLAVKAHAEQLTHTGAAQLIAELGGLSADHLEQSTHDDWEALAVSGVVGTLVPGATLLLRQPFPDARSMCDSGVRVAVATDHNPGSSPFYSLILALQLAIFLGGLSVEEALMAGTARAADALGRPHLGRLEPGALADFVVVDSSSALEPFYRWGDAPFHAVSVGGIPHPQHGSG